MSNQKQEQNTGERAGSNENISQFLSNISSTTSNIVETLKQAGESNTKRGNSRKVSRTTTDGTVIFDSIAQAQRENGIAQHVIRKSISENKGEWSDVND